MSSLPRDHRADTEDHILGRDHVPRSALKQSIRGLTLEDLIRKKREATTGNSIKAHHFPVLSLSVFIFNFKSSYIYLTDFFFFLFF